MKKFIAALMTVILVFQIIPCASLAEEALTEAELAAAYALTGFGETNGFHSAESSSVENMTGRELVHYLDTILDNQIHSLENYYEDIENTLFHLERENPSSYAALTSGRFADMPDTVHTRFREMEAIRAKLEYWRSRLDTQTCVINNNMDMLSNLPGSDYDTRLRNHRIREAAAEIREIRSEVAEEIQDHVAVLEGQITEMACPAYASGGVGAGTTVGGWASELLNASEPVVLETGFSSASLFPKQQTLLGRLSPISGALADQTDANLTVLSDQQNAVTVKDASQNAISGATVIVTDVRSKKDSRKSVTGTTDAKGQFIFENAGFELNDDMLLCSVEVQADGCQIAVFDEVELKKGNAFHVSPQKMSAGAPYPYIAGCSFDGSDVLYSAYNALYSPRNDYQFPIRVTVINPTDTDCIVNLMYQHATKGQYYHTMGARKSNGQEDTSDTKVPAHGRAVLVTRLDWRATLKPGGSKFEWDVDGETKTGSKKEVLQLAIQDGAEAEKNFTSGSPKMASGHYSVTSTLLTVEKAKLEEPIIESKMVSSFFSQGANFFNFTFPITDDLGPAFKSASFGLDLPFAKIIPRVSVAIDGSTSVIIGVDPGDFTSKDGPLINWKSQDTKKVEAALSEQDKKNTFSKKIAKGGSQIAQMYGGGLSLRSVKGTIGVFLGLTYKVEHEQNPSEGDPKWTSKNLAGLLGIVPCLTYEASYNWFAGPFPLTVGVNISASLAIVGMLGGTVSVNCDTDLTNEGIQHSGLNPKYEGMSILLSIMITVFAGVGIKGLLSATINAYGYINLLFELKGDKFTHLKIWMGFGLYIYLEFLFVHYRQNLVDSPEVVLFEGSWPKANASLGRTFSRLFIPGAEAEEETPETEKAASLTATDYPDLTAESEKVVGPIQQKGTGMKLLEIGNVMYAFYLTAEAGDNKKSRVTWTNLETGASGTFEDALKRASEKQSLFFNNTTRDLDSGGTPPSIVDDVFRDSNAVLYGQDDVAFDVVPMEIDDDAKNVYRSLYTLAVVNADVAESDDEIILNGTPSLYMLAFTQDMKGNLTCDIPLLYRQNSGSTIGRYYGIGFNMLYSRPASGDEASLKELVTSGVTTCAALTMQDKTHKNTLATVNITAGSNLATFLCFMPFAYDDSWTAHLEGTYQCRPDVTAHEGVLQVGVTPAAYAGETYYLLEEDGAGKNTLTYKGPYQSPIEKDAEIPYFRILGSTNVDYLFYITTETVTTEDGEVKTLHHLKAANLEHWPGIRQLPEYTFTDPDITIPAAKFNVQKVAGTIYVYWLESTTDENDRSKLIYRLRGVAYDPASGVASDDFILAQFYPPESQSMGDLVLTDLGKGYFVMDNNIYSFPFQLKAAMDLEDIILVDDVVGEGENDLVTLRLVNNGNMAINAFTIIESAVELKDDGQGHIVPSGDEEKVLTLKAVTTDPSQNRVHLEGDDPELDITGKEACWREPLVMDKNMDNVLPQDQWNVEQVVRTFSDRTHYTDEKKTASLKTTEILPGQVALFDMLIKVPSGWVGKTHKLKLSLDSYSAPVSQVRSMALQSGLLPESYALQGTETVTYSRNADGTMSVGGSALRQSGSGIFIGGVTAPQDAVLDHDLDNLVVQNRVYLHASGEKRLSITVTNDTVDHDALRLYCEVYLDGSETPIYMDLPYDSESTAHARTHTIDLPLSAITGGREAYKATVTIRGIGIQETTLLDNSFDVILEEDQLRIVVHPQDRTALEGETVTMTVQAAGGITPYYYQWQEYLGESLGWRDIQGATSDTLTLEKVTLGMSGRKYRCVVTDQNMDSVTSNEAVLTVRKKLLPTGDASQPLLILLAAVALLACWFLIRRKQGKRG